MEVCVPVDDEKRTKALATRRIEAGKALHVTHIGSYEKLGEAYKALFDYARENKLDYGAPIYEIYEKGEGSAMRGNKENYITQIYLPVINER